MNYKQKITDSTGNNGGKAVKIIVPLKYLISFWRTLEMPIIDCKINLILTWSANCVIYNATATVLVVILSTQDNSKLLQWLKSEFKRTVNWNKY